MAHEKQPEAVSYYDVAKWADDLERHYHCHTHFEWWANEVRGRGIVWAIRLVAIWKGVGAVVARERGWSREWPHNDYKTPAACMMRLVWDAEDVLYEEEERAAEAQQARLFFGQE